MRNTNLIGNEGESSVSESWRNLVFWLKGGAHGQKS